MHTIKKRLVYHLYIYDNCFESKLYKLHLELLSRYAHIFDQAIFVLALDDVENENLIKLAEKTVFNKIFIKDIKFIVKYNDGYREASTFYSEVAEKLGELDGLTFFAHIKGAGNELSGNVDMNQVYNWVIASYYFNLTYMDEVEYYLVNHPSFNTYGSLKCKWDNIENKYSWIYSGTFFWINGQRAYMHMKNREIPMPPLNNRYCAETFCGNVFQFDNAESAVHKMFHYFAKEGVLFLNWYKFATEFIEDFLDDTNREDFYNLKNNLFKTIGYEE